MIGDKLVISYDALPPSKNRKTSQTFWGQNVRASCVDDFFDDVTTFVDYDSELLDQLKNRFDNKKELIQITIQVYEPEQKRDPENYVELLLDGVQKITGINDRKFITTMKPRLYGEKESMECELEVIENPFPRSKHEQKSRTMVHAKSKKSATVYQEFTKQH